MKIWVKIGNTPKRQVEIAKSKEDCWEDFRTKTTQEVGHDNWKARIFTPGGKEKGKKWVASNEKPKENDTVMVQIANEKVSRIDLDPPAPIPERMVAHPKETPIEERPIELVTLEEVLGAAPSHACRKED
jgi:hypothetical protein